MSNELTKEQKKQLQKALDAIINEAKNVVDDYVKIHQQLVVVYIRVKVKLKEQV